MKFFTKSVFCLILLAVCSNISAQQKGNIYGGMRFGVAYKKSPLFKSQEGTNFSVEALNATLLSFFIKHHRIGHTITLVSYGGGRYVDANNKTIEIPYENQKTGEIINKKGDCGSIQLDYTLVYYFLRTKRFKMAAGGRIGVGGIYTYPMSDIENPKDYIVKEAYRIPSSFFYAPVLSAEYYFAKRLGVYLSGSVEKHSFTHMFQTEAGLICNF